MALHPDSLPPHVRAAAEAAAYNQSAMQQANAVYNAAPTADLIAKTMQAAQADQKQIYKDAAITVASYHDHPVARQLLGHDQMLADAGKKKSFFSR